MIDRDEAGRRTEGLLGALSARAAGWWTVETKTCCTSCQAKGPCLVLMAFRGARDLDRSVAREFESATAVVPLEQVELGIVRAVVEKVPAVSIAEALPAHLGSGQWLRAFEAARSVAVPLLDGRGEVSGVLSVALPTVGPPDDASVASLVRAWAGGEGR